MNDTTVCIKTLLRPRLLDRLLDSMWDVRGPVLVTDDSPVETREETEAICISYGVGYLPLPEDVGLSAGRNAMLDAIQTPYFVMLDDDFVFTSRTDLPALLAPVRDGDFDLTGGTVMHKGTITHFEGFFKVEDRVMKLRPLKHPVKEPTACDIVYNFLGGVTDRIRTVRWDDRLKLCEHQAFFIRAKEQGVRVGYVPESVIDHRPEAPPEYTAYRKVRSNEYYALFCRLYDLDGVQGSLAA